MKSRANPQGCFLLCGVLMVFALITLGPLSAQAAITEIIDATGDGKGNALNFPQGIAVDGSGIVYVAGDGSDNAFKIAGPAAVPALSLRGVLLALLLLALFGAAGLSRRRRRGVA